MTIGALCRHLDFSAYSSRIVHPFVRLLRSSSPSDVSLRDDIMGTLSMLIVQLKDNFTVFIPID